MDANMNSDIALDTTFRPRWQRFGEGKPWYLEYTRIIKGRVDGGASGVIHTWHAGGYRLALRLTSLSKPEVNYEEFYPTSKECRERGKTLIKQEWGLT